MKNISIKVLSIVMTLAVLVGLIASVVPVSAADLAWTKLVSPAVTVRTDANIFAFAPDGKTLYLYDGAALRKSVNAGLTWTTTGVGTNLPTGITKIVVNPDNALSLVATDGTDVYRSTNGGSSWYPFNPADTPDTDATVTDVDIANGASGDAILVAYADPVGAGTNNHGGVAYFDTANGIWLTTWDATNTLGEAGAWDAANALAVAFSADFANDYGIMAIAGDTANIEVRSIYVASTPDAGWSLDIAPASMAVANTAATKADFAFASDFAMGNTTYGKCFIFVDDVYRFAPRVQNDALTATSTLVGLDAGVTPASIDFAGPIATGTLAVGATNEGAINTIKNIATATSNFVWTPSTKNPRGGAAPNTMVKFQPTTTTLYAGTEGDSFTGTTATATATVVGGAVTVITVVNAGAGYTAAPTVTIADANQGAGGVVATATATINAAGQVTGFTITNAGTLLTATTTVTIAAPQGFGYGSALSTSTDYDSFDGISMVSVSNLEAVQMPFGGLTGVGGATQFQKMYDANAELFLLFKSVDSGATWQYIYQSANDITVNLSPSFATDNTIYLTQKVNAAPPANVPLNKFVKSVDGGKTWTSGTIIGSVKASAFAPIDGSNYWIGSAAGIRSTSTATVYLNGTAPMAIIALPGCMLIWGGDGNWWYSTDNGVSFTNTNSLEAIGGQSFTWTFGFDGTNWTIYIVDASNNIQSYTVGVSATWAIYKNASIWPATMDAVSSISNAPGGVWYFTSTGDTDGQVWRSTNFAAAVPTIEPIAGTAPTALGGNIASIPALAAQANAAGNNVLYTNIAGTATATAYGPVWKTYTDSVLAAPKITAPAANASVPATFDVTWDAVAKATAYDVQVAYDAAFSNIAASTANHASTVWTQVELLPGKTYFIRVRVAENAPMASSWSAAVTFTTMLPSSGSLVIDATGRIYPTNGATGISINPAFTWGSVGGAATYDFKISSKADFSDTIDSATGLKTTVYSAAVALKAGTTYFWEVRAVNGAITGDWVTNAFTTAADVTVGPSSTAPVITVTVPTPTFTIPQATVNVSIPPITGPAADNTTPAWVWVIIAIGAVLVIAVIVLIARTRRV